MTSIWNRIRSARSPNSEIISKEAKEISPTSTNKNTEIITPWTISSNPINKTTEPLKEFWIRTGVFRVSSQKLNMLGRQISRLPLPKAILQMKFSPKKAARDVYSLLMQAQARIINASNPADPSKFVIQQALVCKGTYLKRIDIKGRGRHGIIWRPHSFMRIQVAIPDAEKDLLKRFKVRVPKEDKPVMVRLNY